MEAKFLHLCMQAGCILLREYIFIHIPEDQPADKLSMLLAMVHKLYAMVAGAACDDNADALTHHEIMLPGHLLLKFMKEKLSDALNLLKDQVQGHNKHVHTCFGLVTLNHGACFCAPDNPTCGGIITSPSKCM